jgi:hypothetical protein
MAFLCFAFLVCWSRFQLEKMRREVEEAEAMESLMEPGGSSAQISKAKVPLGRGSQ